MKLFDAHRIFNLLVAFGFGLILVLFLIIFLFGCAPYPTINTADDYRKVMEVGGAQGCMYFNGTGHPPASAMRIVLVQKYGVDTATFDIKKCFDSIPVDLRNRLLGGD